MCNIAGYVGEKRAAPILIEMLKKQEFLDGGLGTGIATIHEGKLYSAKVIGSVDTLLKETDALNFPGNIGIIHSRPDDNFIEYIHPFVSEEGKTAIVENGNMCGDEGVRNRIKEVIDLLLENGYVFESAHDLGPKHPYPPLPDGRRISFIELHAKYIEHLRKTTDMSYPEAFSKSTSDIFADEVSVMVTANTPENIYVSRVTRPMNIMKKKDGCYLATSQLAFPDWQEAEYIKSLPHMATSTITKDGFEVSPYPITTGNVIDFTEEEYNNIKEEIRKKLEKEPLALDSLGGGIFVRNTSPDKFRPNAKASYDALWELFKEGVLERYDEMSEFSWMPGKKVMKTFFYLK